jgi:hypothetical protein
VDGEVQKVVRPSLVLAGEQPELEQRVLTWVSEQDEPVWVQLVQAQGKERPVLVLAAGPLLQTQEGQPETAWEVPQIC